MNNDTNTSANEKPVQPQFEVACADMDEAEVRRLMAECADEKFKLMDFAPAVNDVMAKIAKGEAKSTAISEVVERQYWRDDDKPTQKKAKSRLKMWVQWHNKHPIKK